MRCEYFQSISRRASLPSLMFCGPIRTFDRNMDGARHALYDFTRNANSPRKPINHELDKATVCLSSQNYHVWQLRG